MPPRPALDAALAAAAVPPQEHELLTMIAKVALSVRHLYGCAAEARPDDALLADIATGAVETLVLVALRSTHITQSAMVDLIEATVSDLEAHAAAERLAAAPAVGGVQ